jgi:hypothetical protein
MDDKQIQLLDETAKDVAVLMQEKERKIATAIQIGKGIQKLKNFILEDKGFTETLMSLQGTKIGFITDRDKSGGYPENVVSECALDALLRGLCLHDNQWNIISGQMYITKNGLKHILDNMPDLFNLQITIGSPQMGESEAKVRCRASWTIKGLKMAIGEEENDPCVIVVRTNRGMGIDAVIGKATRKLYARIYERCTGSIAPEGDAEELTKEIRNVTPEMSIKNKIEMD